MSKHQNADVLVNFASLRSAYDSTIETLNYPQVRMKRAMILLFLHYLILMQMI